jgi:hypothetical protein
MENPESLTSLLEQHFLIFGEVATAYRDNDKKGLMRKSYSMRVNNEKLVQRLRQIDSQFPADTFVHTRTEDTFDFISRLCECRKDLDVESNYINSLDFARKVVIRHTGVYNSPAEVRLRQYALHLQRSLSFCTPDSKHENGFFSNLRALIPISSALAQDLQKAFVGNKYKL